MFWSKLSSKQVTSRVLNCLNENADFYRDTIVGIPGTYLDKKVFPIDENLLNDCPYLTTFVSNPNHIGLHTSGDSEVFFKGTQELEREVIKICACEILKAKKSDYDGYVSPGGTESNIVGIWNARNYLKEKFNIDFSSVGIIHTVDTHYSISKAADLMNIRSIPITVNNKNREIDKEILKEKIRFSKKNGINYFIVILNMGTTMFGSVDNSSIFENILDKEKVEYVIHVDAAFGGFLYPFTNNKNLLSFQNEKIMSFSLDAHKLLQAPYGTGMYIARKGYMDCLENKGASYIQGNDNTLCGSRSGANAVAIWMILMSYGSRGRKKYCESLLARSNQLANGLRNLDIPFYQNPFMNIVAIDARFVAYEVFKKFNLVPDNHHSPSWFKFVSMDHVTQDHVNDLLLDLSAEK
jgi:tyrosine decarboxylase / aspartate 1-decarboxylase